MKKFLAVAALVAVSSVGAEELKFGDLNYFLKGGQSNLRADFLVNNESARTDETDETEFDAYVIDTRFAHGFSDRFNITLGIDTILDGQTEENNGPSSDDQGFQNPRVGANYRLLTQDADAVNFDLGLEGTINVTDRKVSTEGRDGNTPDPMLFNLTDPRSGVELTARVGRKWNEANEYYILAGANYHADGDYEYAGATEVELDSSVDYRLGAFYQYRPVNEFMMTVGVEGTQFGETEGKFDTVDVTRESHIDYQFSFLAKYLITDAFIAKFILTQDKRSDYDLENPVGATKFDRRNGAQYGFGVDYLF